MDTEDATSTQPPSELTAPVASETTASAAVSDATREMTVQVRDRADSVSDLEPATRTPRYGRSQSSSEPIGPLATLLFYPAVVEAVSARCDQMEGRAESDHEEVTQSPSFSATTAALLLVWVTDFGKHFCGRFLHNKLGGSFCSTSLFFIATKKASSRLTNLTCMWFVRQRRLRALWSKQRNLTRFHNQRSQRRNGPR